MQVISKENANTLINNARHILYKLPNSDNMLDYYKTILHQCLNDNFQPTYLYQRTLSYFNSSFTLYWDTEKLINIAEHCPQSFVETSFAYKLVDKDNILDSELFKYNNSPIILAAAPFLYKKFIPVDGNHRIVTSYKLKRKFMKAVILTPYQHCVAMNSCSENVFKVCCNLYLYNAYISEAIEKDSLEKFLFKL